MSFFKNIFGGGPTTEDMYKLLSGPSTEMSNEMERIYRNQISIYQEVFQDIDLSAKGILKARLFGVTFMLFAFGKKWGDEAALKKMMNLSSGVAMEPFSSPSYQPSIDKATAASFSGDYMMNVFRAIASEMKSPSTPTKQSDGFKMLHELYEDALKESIGKRMHTSDTKENCIRRFKVWKIGSDAIHANLNQMEEEIEWMKEWKDPNR